MRLIWSDIIDLTCGSSDQYHSAFYLIERIFQWMVFTVEIFIKESSFTRKMIHREMEKWKINVMLVSARFHALDIWTTFLLPVPVPLDKFCARHKTMRPAPRVGDV